MESTLNREINICSLDPWDFPWFMFLVYVSVQSKIESKDIVWYFLSRREIKVLVFLRESSDISSNQIKSEWVMHELHYTLLPKNRWMSSDEMKKWLSTRWFHVHEFKI
ncbi:NAC domain protein [Raphanus sativus]|nr:NAC domain protein [Raphanus sativus]